MTGISPWRAAIKLNLAGTSSLRGFAGRYLSLQTYFGVRITGGGFQSPSPAGRMEGGVSFGQ